MIDFKKYVLDIYRTGHMNNENSLVGLDMFINNIQNGKNVDRSPRPDEFYEKLKPEYEAMGESQRDRAYDEYVMWDRAYKEENERKFGEILARELINSITREAE